MTRIRRTGVESVVVTWVAVCASVQCCRRSTESCSVAPSARRNGDVVDDVIPEASTQRVLVVGSGRVENTQRWAEAPLSGRRVQVNGVVGDVQIRLPASGEIKTDRRASASGAGQLLECGLSIFDQAAIKDCQRHRPAGDNDAAFVVALKRWSRRIADLPSCKTFCVVPPSRVMPLLSMTAPGRRCRGEPSDAVVKEVLILPIRENPLNSIVAVGNIGNRIPPDVITGETCCR